MCNFSKVAEIARIKSHIWFQNLSLYFTLLLYLMSKSLKKKKVYPNYLPSPLLTLRSTYWDSIYLQEWNLRTYSQLIFALLVFYFQNLCFFFLMVEVVVLQLQDAYKLLWSLLTKWCQHHLCIFIALSFMCIFILHHCKL
jgi:hypothetical protein